MDGTISEMEIEIEQKDNNIKFLEDKIGIPDSKIVEEINRMDLCKISSRDKSDRTMIRINKTPNKHETIKN